jgi:hypothetical protein
MVGELITLPVRIGVRATELWLRAAEQTLGVAANADGRLIDAAIPRASASPDAGGRQTPSTPGTTASAAATQAPAREPAATGRPASAPTAQAAPSAPPAPPPAEALDTLVGGGPHVSEEPELVEEFAEPGAEDGAGAEIHVDEPWDGYRQMNAKEVVARLAAATPAELAAVQLYEGGNRGRQTILAAAQRALRSANGRGPQS